MNRECTTTTPRRRSRLAGTLTLLLLLLLGLTGCGSMASPSDPVEGLKVLQTTLDAWKAGEQPADLAKRTPPIHVSDGDWLSGLRLQNYSTGENKLVGSDVNYNVVLELKNAKGAAVKKDAVYAVTTSPKLLVNRQDSL